MSKNPFTDISYKETFDIVNVWQNEKLVMEQNQEAAIVALGIPRNLMGVLLKEETTMKPLEIRNEEQTTV